MRLAPGNLSDRIRPVTMPESSLLFTCQPYPLVQYLMRITAIRTETRFANTLSFLIILILWAFISKNIHTAIKIPDKDQLAGLIKIMRVFDTWRKQSPSRVVPLDAVFLQRPARRLTR